MMFSPQDAAKALHDVEEAQHRSETLHGYESAAPHLMLWAALWAAGYGLNYLVPTRSGAVWAVIIGIGLVAGLAALRGKRGALAWRYGAVFATLIGFSAAAFAVLGPVDGTQVAAFIPLVVATAYVLGGLWLGVRFVVAGIVLGVLTLGGFFLLREYFMLWMAVVGSGALLLAGLWLRRA